MRLLLDTHALIWWLVDHPALSPAARAAIAEPENAVFVSAASAWEIATKHRVGKLPFAGPLVGQLTAVLRREQFAALPVNLVHAELAGQMPGEHRDPFDRMLVAQALVEKLALVSNERLFDDFGVDRHW